MPGIDASNFFSDEWTSFIYEPIDTSIYNPAEYQNTMRKSQVYREKIRLIQEGKAIPVQPIYCIAVGFQRNFIEEVDKVCDSYGNDHLGTQILDNIVADIAKNTMKTIAVLDYHIIDASSASPPPMQEQACLFSRAMQSEHNACKSEDEILQTVATPMLAATCDIINGVSNNFYGYIKRNGDIEMSPSDTLVSTINNINNSCLSGTFNSILFPPVFNIVGFFVDDMITDIALTLREKFPNSLINIPSQYCISLRNFENFSDTAITQKDVSTLMQIIDTNAVVTPQDVIYDISEKPAGD